MATVKKLIIEVVSARNLRPKDGHGSASPFAVVDYGGQRRKTKTVRRNLNPQWSEVLEFQVDGSRDAADEVLEIDLLHDRRSDMKGNNFLGRLRLNSDQFVQKGEEALIFYPLEKKNFFSWVRGEIGLKVYYVDEAPPPPPPPPPATATPTPPPPPPPPPPTESPIDPSEKSLDVTGGQPNVQKPDGTAESPVSDANPSNEKPDKPPTPPHEVEQSPPVSNPTSADSQRTDGSKSPTPSGAEEDSAKEIPRPVPENVQAAEPSQQPEQPSTLLGIPDSQTTVSGEPKEFPSQQSQLQPRAYHGDGGLPERFPSCIIERSAYDLVEKMHYIFIRIVKARSLPATANPYVKISVSGVEVRSKIASRTNLFEWDQTFAFGGDAHESAANLDVSIWDAQRSSDAAGGEGGDSFLGGICFDASEIPLRDPPDSPLAPQWYRLEGVRTHRGDLMLATWVGTQADESFFEAWKADARESAQSRSKVYLSPKLWYLRVTAIEAQDLPVSAPLKDPAVSIRAQLGFQSHRTRSAGGRSGSPSWNEDIIFVAAEPFGDHPLHLSVESRLGKDSTVLGTAEIPLAAIDRRVDDMKVGSRWFNLHSPATGGYGGRLHVRTCFDGGYHVADEPPHTASDFRPSARQLWKPPLGAVELGILGCRNLIPVKAVAGKGTADAYVVAKYGEKWIRSRTVVDTLDPRWNEQYTWQVYDLSTVLTVGVFDSATEVNDVPKDGTVQDVHIGKVRIRICTLESNRVYKGSYPLLLMLPTGAKKMGEIELAVRLVRSAPSLDVLHAYFQPLMPRMHHLRPIGQFQQEVLRQTATKLVAQHLSRAEPPLRSEVVLRMLDADASGFSMRRVRANWNRVTSCLIRVLDLAHWVEEVRSWRNPMVTVMVHMLLVFLVWRPDLLFPTAAIYVFFVGAWNRRRRVRILMPHPCPKASQAEIAAPEELDEEFDPIPSSRGPEVVRARYDRLRIFGARIQVVLGDLAAQGERIQALVAWRDPRATGIFIGFCFVISVLMLAVPTKMVATAAGFYCLRHPLFRDRMPSPGLNFFRRLPSLSDRLM